MSKRIKVILVTTFLLILTAVVTSFTFFRTAISSIANHEKSSAIDFSGAAVPAVFLTVKVGMPKDQITSIVGKPDKVRGNPRFEIKSDAEWISLREKFESARSEQQNPSGIPDLSYIKMGKVLQHRIKEQWIYYPSFKNKIWVSLDFDGNGKLIDAASGTVTTTPPH